MNFLTEKLDWKKMRKIMWQLLSIFSMLKKKKIYPAHVPKINQTMKNIIHYLLLF